MTDEAIITVENLSKTYRIWESPIGRLKSPLIEAVAALFPRSSAPHRALQARAARGWRDFHALRNVSFRIRRGEATGIIGRNGSGKSTLLQLIAGTLTATSGRIDVRGRVSALLELGSGFNPEFTGRENVFLNGSIVGLDKTEMEKKFDSIAAFADIGDFIDQPVKTYSSGMMMRLAFAVAVSLQPDILIIDEALSVGDVFFTQKCFERIREMLAGGATLIFVSHDTAAVQNLCTRGLLLQEGALVHDGGPEECVGRYFSLAPRREAAAASPAPAAATGHPAVRDDLRREVIRHNLIPSARSRHGERQFEFLAAAFFNHQELPHLEIDQCGQGTLRMLVRAHRSFVLPSLGIQVFDRMANLIFAAGTPQLKFPVSSLDAGDEMLIDFRLGFDVQPGEYTLGLDAGEFSLASPNEGIFQDRITGLGPIVVGCGDPLAIRPFYGAARLPLAIHYAV